MRECPPRVPLEQSWKPCRKRGQDVGREEFLVNCLLWQRGLLWQIKGAGRAARTWRVRLSGAGRAAGGARGRGGRAGRQWHCATVLAPWMRCFSEPKNQKQGRQKVRSPPETLTPTEGRTYRGLATTATSSPTRASAFRPKIAPHGSGGDPGLSAPPCAALRPFAAVVAPCAAQQGATPERPSRPTRRWASRPPL